MQVKGIGEVASGGSASGEDRDSEREARVRVGQEWRRRQNNSSGE